MQDQRLFTPTQLSSMHKISKQALLFYDKIGLLPPAYVNPKNGYRYYSSSQLEVLDTIFILKEIGVSLKDIKAFLQNRSTTTAIAMLNCKKQLLKEKIDEDIRILSRLSGKLEILKNCEAATPHSKISYTLLPTRHIYLQSVAPPFTLTDTDIAIKKLLLALTEKKVSYNYQTGVIIPHDCLLNERFLSASHVFTMLYKKINLESYSTIPAGLYAIFYHKGSYPDIADTYKCNISKIKKDGYTIVGPSYEECLIDNLCSSADTDYLTKISIMVKK